MQPGAEQDHQTRSVTSLFLSSFYFNILSFFHRVLFSLPVNDTTMFTLGDGKFQTFFFISNLRVTTVVVALNRSAQLWLLLSHLANRNGGNKGGLFKCEPGFLIFFIWIFNTKLYVTKFQETNL